MLLPAMWFHCHMWIQTGVRVRKRLSWVLTSVTLTFDLWPWPFAWTSLFTMVITPENFMMIRWWEHGEKGVTDGRTDRRTDRQTENTICRAAWSQLKTKLTAHHLASCNHRKEDWRELNYGEVIAQQWSVTRVCDSYLSHSYTNKVYLRRSKVVIKAFS